jgi:excinuclease UvrABC nuclease subunit
MEHEFMGDQYLVGIDRSEPFIVDGDFVVGMPFNLKQVLQKYGKTIVPDRLGIYHLFYENQLVYIGMSKSIRKRLLRHLADEDMPFNNVLWFCYDDLGYSVKDVLKLEYKMIQKFKPVLNSKGANCR